VLQHSPTAIVVVVIAGRVALALGVSLIVPGASVASGHNITTTATTSLPGIRACHSIYLTQRFLADVVHANIPLIE
jgi:hypothetical protein